MDIKRLINNLHLMDHETKVMMEFCDFLFEEELSVTLEVKLTLEREQNSQF